MEKITRFMFRWKFVILVLVAAVTVFCGIRMTQVQLNSDTATYLSDEDMSKKSLKFVSETFNIEGDAMLAVEMPLQDYNRLKPIVTAIEKVENVASVVWIGTFEETLFTENGENLLPTPEKWNKIGNSVPLAGSVFEGMAREIAAKYYKDNTYLAYVSFSVPSSDAKAHAALDEINDLLRDVNAPYYLGGTAMQSKVMLDSALGDLPKFLVVAVVIIFFLLLLTTKSYLEPVVFLLTIGVAIVLNLGTCFGDVSTVTFSAAAILQLALAMDYSIFLTHAFHREKDAQPDSQKAMAAALKKTIVAISASALTTVAGFCALFVMQFGLGFNLGLVLAKGVLLSLICVCVLQPCLLFALQKPIDKTSHKAWNPQFRLLQKAPFRWKYVALALALILVIPAFVAQLQVDYYFLDSHQNENATGPQAVVQNMGSQLLIAVPNGDDGAKQAEFLQKVKALNTEKEIKINDLTGYYTFMDPSYESMLSNPFLQNIPKIKAMVTMAEEMKEQYVRTVGEETYTFYQILTEGSSESLTASRVLDDVTSIANETFGKQKIYVTGNAQVVKDLEATTSRDFNVVAVLSALLILVILILTFRSFVLPILLVAVIELGIFLNLAITVWMGMSINFITYIIISAIQLGATVDYAILMTSKMREHIQTLPKGDAMKKAVGESAFSIFISAAILISACLSVYFVASDEIIREITLMIARGSFISMLLVLLLLPCLFLLLKEKFLGKKTTPPTPPTGTESREESLSANAPQMESSEILTETEPTTDASVPTEPQREA